MVTRYVPEQRKRVHCVAEITLSTMFLFASEVPAIAVFARSGLPNGALGYHFFKQLSLKLSSAAATFGVTPIASDDVGEFAWGDVVVRSALGVFVQVVIV